MAAMKKRMNFILLGENPELLEREWPSTKESTILEKGLMGRIVY
jgi:hypothetical protein